MRLGQQDGSRLGTHLYYELRYESLLADPEREGAALCAFLGLAYNESMLRFHEGERASTNPGLDARQPRRPITPGLRDWRTQMPPADVERFEAVAGELLDELGYPRAVPRPRSEALEHAAGVRGRFAEDLRARGRRLPGGWA